MEEARLAEGNAKVEKLVSQTQTRAKPCAYVEEAVRRWELGIGPRLAVGELCHHVSAFLKRETAKVAAGEWDEGHQDDDDDLLKVVARVWKRFPTWTSCLMTKVAGVVG